MPVNNEHNRQRLAKWMMTQLNDDDIDAIAEERLCDVWSRDEPAFQHDANVYAVESAGFQANWTESDDPYDWRCKECGSVCVYAQVFMDMNTQRVVDTEPITNTYRCRGCEHKRGTGEIKYLERFNPETGEWENP